MGDIQDKALSQGRKTLCRQQYHFRHIHGIQVADTLQAGLHDLPERPGLRIYPVDILIVIHPLNIRGSACILDDGQGHIRLQRQKLSPPVGEGNDLVRHQKVFVADIQIIFFKAAHFIGLVAVALVQLSQQQDCLFLFFQTFIHLPAPFPSAPAQ